MPATDHVWVESSTGLAVLDAALADVHELALDTESNSMFAYRERLCLVQLGFGGAPSDEREGAMQLYAIDPLAFDSPAVANEPLLRWLALGRRVLLHGGEYDVAVLKRELGVAPTNLFDTQAAASLLGMVRTGYANLCAELLGVKISKEHQQFDWARRPVPTAARRYALDDVRYLPSLARTIEALVQKADLEEEVAIACQAVAASSPHEGMSDAEKLWRVVGSERLPREALARLVSLVAWREREAEARDQPPGRLVPKETLLKLALAGPTDARSLDGIGLSRRLLNERSESLLEAIATPGTVPDKPRRPPPDPASEARRAKLKTWRDEEAKRRGVTIQAVLPTRALEVLATTPSEPLTAIPQLGDKRIRLYGATLTKLTR